MAIPIIAIFGKNFQNHKQGEFAEIRKFIPVIIFVIFHQKWQINDLRIKTKVLEFLGIQPSYTSTYFWIFLNYENKMKVRDEGTWLKFISGGLVFLRNSRN